MSNENKPRINQSWGEAIAKFLAVVFLSAITMLVLAIVAWAIIKIGEDIRESL